MTQHPTATQHRDLVARPVDALGWVVRRSPALVVAAVVVISAVMLVMSGQAQEAVGNEGVLPDMPEIAAAETLSERFGETGEEVIQVLVKAEEGTLVSADGYAAAIAIDDAVRTAGADRIADVEGRPGVVGWAFPAQLALNGADPGVVDDAVVLAGYEAAIADLPAEQAGFASALLPADAGPASADSALAFVFISTAGLPTEIAAYQDAVLEISESIAGAVEAAELPAGITATPFSPYLMFDDDAFLAELGGLFGAAFVIIMLILGFVYWVRPGAGMNRRRAGRRSAADVLLSMAAIVMAILWMMGTATLLGPGFLEVIGGMTEFTQVIPILLIGLGVDYALHLTSRYREELGAGATVTDGVRGAISSVGGALALATITTAVGFLTNVFSPLPTLGDFGILAAVGIVAAFLITLTFVPAARLLLDRRAERLGRLPAEALGHSSERVLPGLMARTAVLAERVPVPTLAVTVMLAGLGVFGMTQLETRFSQMDFIPDGSPVLDTIDELSERFNGGYGETTEVLVNGPIATSAVHNALVEAHEALAGVDDVVVHGGAANADSAVTLLARLLAPGPDGRPVGPPVADAAAAVGVGVDLTVPGGADVTALYSAMASAAPEAAEQLFAGDGNGSYDSARIVVQTTAGEERAEQLAAALDEVFAPLEAGGASVTATSEGIITHVVVTAIEGSQLTSLAITLLVAMLLLIAVFAYEQRRPLLGVITTVPVMLVVLWTFGMMALTGIPLGPITAMIAALAIGIGLPYAIHVVHRFTEDRGRHANVGDAIRSTVRHTGGAMAGSAFTTMAGFGILVTSSLVPFRQLGAVMVYAVGLSLIAATLVLPSLLVLWDRWHQRSATVNTIELDEAAELVPV